MGLEDKIDITDDVSSADAILVPSYEMKQTSWIRGVAKFHKLPVFVIKVYKPYWFSTVCSLFLFMDVFWLIFVNSAVNYNGTNGKGSPHDSRDGYI